jgi:hypothetical protein
MWPFRTKQPKAKPGQTFQEWQRSYVPPAAPPIPDPIKVESVCPLCFLRYAPGTLSSRAPFCSDCSSEGIDFPAEPLDSYLAGKSIADFDLMLQHWDSVEGFRPEYKAQKAARMRELKALKLASS